MLKLQPTEPEWLDVLPGVSVRFAPITIKAVRAAREAVCEALGVDEEDYIGAGDALSRELIRRGILGGGEWSGVGDKAGDVLPVTPESVEQFLADPTAFEAADQAYVRPWAKRDMEGNVSAGSPPGTGAAAMPADDTANSVAVPNEPAAAKPAPTSSTSPKRTKPKRSGQS